MCRSSRRSKALVGAAARQFTEFGCTVEERDPGWADPGPVHEVIYSTAFAARLGGRMDERPEWTEPSLGGSLTSAGRDPAPSS